MVASNFPNPGYEMFVNGAWTTITSDMYVEGGTTYSRGRRSEGSNTDYGSATLNLKNLDGKYSNRNPSSPYYGKIGRNTPFRQSLQVPDHFLNIPSGAVSSVYNTLDVPALDIVGDIDLRVEIAPDFWTGYSSTLTNTGWSIATKWSNGGNRSWWWGVTATGTVEFAWSADGTNAIVTRSTEAVRASPGTRVALRVTLDVNNGASGSTVTFYTSTSGLAGTWTQLGLPVVTAGVTSISNSTVAIWVGDDSTSTPLTTRVGRKIYKFEVRNGIGGTVVANPDWTIQTVGTGAFVDAAGRTWDRVGSASIMDRVYRFVTEGSEWSPRWGVGGKKVITPVETSGIMRRLSQGTKPVESALYHRYLNWANPADLPVAYWPMEDGKFTTLSKSPLPGVSPLTVSNMKMADNDTCPPSAPLPTLTSYSLIEAPVPKTNLTGSWQIEMTVRMDSAPSNNSTLFEFTTASAAPWTIWRLQVSSGLMQLVVESGDGATTLVLATSNPPNMFGTGWLKWVIFVIESGADLFVVTTWQPLLEQGLGVVNANSATLTNTTAGRINNIRCRFGKDLSGASIGHLAYWADLTSSDSAADNAFNGDLAGTRMMNLSASQGVPFFGMGVLADEEPVGYQRAETYMDLMREAESGDGGALCEDRSIAGLLYRDRGSMYTQIPALTIPYGHLTAPIEPTDDDQRIRNQTTVNRKDGASSTVSLDTGPMSTQDFPNGVGLYDQSVTLSLADDNRTATWAGWLNHMGTWDEARYPKIRLLLHEHPEYIKDVIGIDTGSIIRITNTPAWLPPGPIDLMVEGYEETTRPHWWEITFSCSPAGPWNVAIVGGSGALADEYGRASSTGSKVAMDMNTTANTMLVETTQPVTRDSHALWTPTSSHYPMTLNVGGEVVTVATAATPMLNDTFTRSVGSGWGTADDGQAWSTNGGSTSDRSVNGTQGVITLNTTGTVRYQYLNAQSARDVEATCVISCSAVATGATIAGGLTCRYANSTSVYFVRVHFNTSGTVFLSVISNGTQILTTEASGYSYSAGTLFNLRMRVVGHRVLGKIWPINDGEPVNWLIDRTVDSTITDAGFVGTMAHAFTGNTNVAPQIRYDSVQVYNPQRFAGITRSVNGVVKSHTGGNSTVQVYKPAIAAL